MPVTALPPIVAVVGATAAGKTGLSLALAEQLDGEIVNTDALAVYRGMDIGTAKPTREEQARAPHHLLDLLEVTEPLTVAEFQALARETIHAVRARGRVPVLVGGSALYTRAVLDRFEFPGTDPERRARLEAALETDGVSGLHARLRDLDPEAADRIRPENARRIVRALEVIELTGRPFTASLPDLEYTDPASVQVGVDIDRSTLDERIEQRVSLMFDDGLVEEVRRLLDAGLDRGRTAREAIGYRQVAAHLRGECSLEEARTQTVTATRRFARRQDAWFRKDPRIAWVPWDASDRVEQAVVAVDAVARAAAT